MSVCKDKNGKWFVKLSYTNSNGKKIDTTKRGFDRKSEAVSWERNFLASPESDKSNMTFRQLVEIYRFEHYPRIKAVTSEALDNIIEHKLLPVFGEMKLCEITPQKILRWQNELLQSTNSKTGKPLKASYVNKLTDNLGSILAHAKKYYDLHENPVFKVDAIKDNCPCSMSFWTMEEFHIFSLALKDDILARTSFDTLYWSGIREGELMALTWNDIDFEASSIRINKTMHYKNGAAIVTTPKTEKGNRTVLIPVKLVEEIRNYKTHCFDTRPDDVVFHVTPYYLHRRMRSTCKITGQTPIRVHDLRHSHVSLLIHLGYSAVDIAKRMGHESTDITFHYAHLFPSVQDQIVSDLENIRRK